MHEGHGILDGVDNHNDHGHDHGHDHHGHGPAEQKNDVARVVAVVIVSLLVIGFLVWKFV